MMLMHAGPHDDFCYVCGSPKALVGCQTCETCYHPSCMSPSLDPNEVPAFWFCPHCVGNDFHIPSGVTEKQRFAPPQCECAFPMNSSPSAPSTNINLATDMPFVMDTGVSAFDNSQEPSEIAQRNDEHPSTFQQPTPPTQESSPTKFRARPQKTVDLSSRPRHNKATRPKNGPPPHKKSKYSALSKDIDKALSVIYSERETAAGYNKSEHNLESKVPALEQQLKMQCGQMRLTSRELELARSELAKEREEMAVMKVDDFELRQEIARLKEELQRKEDELKDWRLKLRSMIGTGLE